MHGDVQVSVEIIDSMERDDLFVTIALSRVLCQIVSLKSVDFS